MSETCNKFLKYIAPGGKILDAGCGSGRDSLYFIKHGYKVVSIDASEEMVRLSSKLTGQQTLLMKFEDVDFKDEFDGIWACASLLHVPKAKIKSVMTKLAQALKENGIFFGSFKYGEGEEYRGERLFNFYDENSLRALFGEIKQLEILEIWITEDVRPGKEGEMWVSCLCRRKN
jgi:2-polyprenyl-3-methyl-5-hydroxy-6-metoxy-1,4-benzoquinol methylase